ncbi:unnamed protein product [Polarella glacialis]|uniref:Adenylate kinase n=1 Tax=Polarella glacialis TaxID=89957 RepID=A0A813E6R1_POLGL|nr:unnamed protein product [Polarella glacialis]CAE8710873.1 unnamed protein product [Polarella glacialis]|mmetsp:Transcript_4921/g.9270  ORF Transcript_4921/g.9270 Transcript_4921/m.9270 type:complete len:1083 (+) Transcript_4921:99-3347(+)
MTSGASTTPVLTGDVQIIRSVDEGFCPPLRTTADPRFKGMIFAVMGPPASGKGTQCKRLAVKYDFVHLSTGDVFRDLAKRGTELGLRAKEFMDKGCFVPDEMVLSLVKDRLGQADVKERGCLLDGFPRTADQAEALLKEVKVEGVILLRAPDKTLVLRATDRRIDPATGDIFHLKYLPPPKDIEARLVCRDRDDEHSFKQRLEVFHGQCRRVLPMFSGSVWQMDATLEPDAVFKNMAGLLDKIMEAKMAKNSSGNGGAMPAASPSCSICFDEPANFLVIPCGHQCGCEECLTAVQKHSGRCPICRASVTAIQRVFRCGRDSGENGEATLSKQVPAKTHPDIQDKLDTKVSGQAGDGWSDDETDDVQSTLEDAKLVIVPCDDIGDAGGEVNVVVSAEIFDKATRSPVDICCVVDVSGSMSAEAKYEDEQGNLKSDGLTVLDIVKHAVKAVLYALKEADRLSLVAFNEKASTVLELTQMTEEGQKKAIAALEAMIPGGQTNIWAGVLAAMDSLRSGAQGPDFSARQQAVLLLTDGQPNVVPPRGHLAELRDYRDSHPGFSFQLNTFGFGYNLDSDLLLQLASEGNGTYAFIPDAVIVGTVFVNSVANVLSTLSQSATLNLMLRNGAEFTGPVLGGFPSLEESWGRAVSLGALQYGQSRELVVPLRLPPNTSGQLKPYLEAVLTYPKAGRNSSAAAEGTARTSSSDAKLGAARADAVTVGYAAIAAAADGKGKSAQEAVAALCSRLAEAVSATGDASGEAAVDGRLTALQADVAGRMSKALNGKERFNRWGKHYLRALMRSHQLQVCTNFMDTGLQLYGGSLFRTLRGEGDQIFLSLPPPVPHSKMGRETARSRSPSPKMTTYYAGAGGGCFGPSSTVCVVSRSLRQLQGTGPLVEALLGLAGSRLPVSEVRAGDVLRVADGIARVRCVARIHRDPAQLLVTLPEGLTITRQHPVRIDGVWMRPCNVPGRCYVPTASGMVYNFVLDRCHVLVVDGVECATWGHGLQGNVIGHPFFGTDRVVHGLSSLEGWEDGRVTITGSIRDDNDEVVALLGPSTPTLETMSHKSRSLSKFSPLLRVAASPILF